MGRVSLVGRRFGEVLVIDLDYRDSRYKAYYKCLCGICGQHFVARHDHLQKGTYVSCGQSGCRPSGKDSATYKHGCKPAYLYTLWAAIKDRCSRESHRYYHRYGGRGIRVCAEWVDDFEAFRDYVLSELGPRPGPKKASSASGFSFDRIDNDGHYEPGNVRWATWEQQARNRSK